MWSLPPSGHRGDVRLGLEDLDTLVHLDVLGAHDARLLHAEIERAALLRVHLERDLLEVEDDVGGILHHARNRRELVQHAVDLHGGDGGAFNRRQQHATQRVADGGAEAALERLRVEPAEPVRQGLALELEPLGSLKSSPEH